METSVCISCHKPKATLACGACTSPVCKNCAQFVGDETFSFLPVVPAELKHEVYCVPCYDQTVAPALETYNATMEKAKEIFVFYKTQGKETRLMKRTRDVIRVAECSDDQEALMKMAFLAAYQNFNAIIDVEVNAKKIRNGAYQTVKWDGYACPTNVNPDRMRGS
ncbi:MAG: hypothetical protein V4736_15035 [Bdellovibrionota bacterium]